MATYTPVEHDPFAGVPAAPAKLTPVDFDPFEERSLGDAFGDAATRTRQGLNSVVGGLSGVPVNLANLVAGSPMMRLLDRAAGRDTTLFEQPDAVRGIRESLAINNAEEEAGLTDRAKAQAAAFQAADGFVPSLEYLFKNPSFLATEGAAQIPQFLQIVPGSLPATIAAQATGAAAQNAQQSEEALRARGASEQDAAAAASNTFAPSLALNAILPMLPGGSAIERALSGQAGKGIAREGASRLGLIMKAIAGETGTEAAQEGLDQVVQNVATDAPIGKGVGQASALGAVLGAPGGAAAGTLDAMMLPQGAPAGAPAPQPAPPAAPPPVAPAPAAAPGASIEALFDSLPPEAAADLDGLLAALTSPPPAPAIQPDAPQVGPGAAATLPPVDPVLDTPESARVPTTRALVPREASDPLEDPDGQPEAPPAPALAPDAARQGDPPDSRPGEAPAPAPLTTEVGSAEDQHAQRTEALAARNLEFIDQEIGWEQIGGRILRENERADGLAADVIGRTSWMGRSSPDGSESALWRFRPDKSLKESQAREALAKFREGKPLRPIEQRFVAHAQKIARDYALDEIETEDMAAAIPEAARLEALRQLRDDYQTEVAQADESEALALVELVQRARDVGLDDLDVAEFAGEAGPDYAARLWREIKNRSSGNGPDQRAAQEDRAGGAEGQAGRQADPAARVAEPAADEVDGLFGAATSRERVAGLERQRDDARNGRTGSGRTDMMAGGGDLFAGPRPEQARIPDAEPDTGELPEKDAAAYGTTRPLFPGVAAPKGPAPIRNQMDLFVATRGGAAPGTGQEPAVKIDRPKLSQHAKLIQTGQFNTGIKNVATLADAAHILAPLRKSPQEQFLVLAIGKDGEALAVMRHTVGLASESLVDPTTVFGAIASVPGVSRVVFAHNHPSGTPEPSAADRALDGRIAALFRDSGIDIMGSIIVQPGRRTFTTYDAGGGGVSGPIPARRRSDSVPMVERTLRKVRPAEDGGVISDPDQSKALVRGLMEETPQGVILLTNRHQVIGVLPYSNSAARLRTGNLETSHAAMLREAVGANAAAAIVYGPDIKIAKNVAGALSAGDLRVLDTIETGNGPMMSHAQRGYFPDGSFDRVENAANAPDGAADVAPLRDAVRAILGDAPVTILRSESELPATIRTRPKRAGMTRKGLFDPKTGNVYVFADAARTPEDAAFTAAHEVAGHRGLRALASEKAQVGGKTARAALNDALDLALQNPTVAKVADSMARTRASGDRMLMAEEALADLAAATRTGDWDYIEDVHGVTVPEGVRAGVKSAIARFVERLRRIINAALAKATGKTAAFTDAQVHELLENAWKAAKRNAPREAPSADESALEQRVFHGTPHRGIEQTGFSLQKIGTGEGAQVYGWGLYFAKQRDIAEHYRKKLSDVHTKLRGQSSNNTRADDHVAAREIAMLVAGSGESFNDARAAVVGRFRLSAKLGREAAERDRVRGETERARKTMKIAELDEARADAAAAINESDMEIELSGQLYHAEVPEDADLLDWDKPLSEQPEKVRAALVENVDASDALVNLAAEKMAGTDFRRMEVEERDEAIEAFHASGLSVVEVVPELTGEQLYQALSRERGPGGASEALRDAGIPGLRYLDGSSRNRPFKDVVREFRKELPDDAEFQDVIDLFGTGKFSPKNETLLKALAADDWLGFEYPAQAISAALGRDLGNYDASQDLRNAVSDALSGGTHNYVIWDEGAISDVEALYDDRADPFQNNASGESSASVEAMNRLRDERDAGRVRMVIERNGTVRPLIGVDAVDAVARSGQIIVQRNVGRDEWTVLSQGSDVSRDLAQGRINASRRALEEAAADEDVALDSVVDDQTQTPAFKRWFGDSKVVDADGKPLVVYHATDVDFDTFLAQQNADIGFHFGSAEAASARADSLRDGIGRRWNKRGERTLAVYLSIKNPLRVADYSFFSIKDRNAEDDNLIWELREAGINALPGMSSREAIAAIEAAGYDGLVYENIWEGGGDSYAAFRPEQIKSATGNRGTFDPENPSILYSDVPDRVRAARGRADAKREQAFKRWFGDSKVVDADGNPRVVYHGTSAKFNSFSPKKAIGGQHWFTTDRAAVERREVGASGHGRIIDAYLSIKNPAGWKEYDKLTLDQLIARGYDGLALTDGGETTYVAFDPKQIKSATGNRGTFDPESTNIMYSDVPDRARVARGRADAKREVARDTLGGPTTGGAVGWNFDDGQWEGRNGAMRRARAKLDDKMIAWRDVQDTIAQHIGNTIPDAQNVYRLENLMHGRVKEGIDALEANRIVPLMKAMGEAKVDVATLEEYLYARHARERNAHIAKINPKMPDGGSGMTNAEADAILAKPAPPANIVRMVDAITKQTRRRLLEHGLITQEAFDAMESQYSAYVPLRGKRTKETEFEESQGTAGRGIDGRRAPIKQALGRGAGNRAQHILGEIIGDAQRSIIAAEKARVGRAVMRIVLANPNPNLWTVEPVQTERKVDATGEVYDSVVNDWSDPSLVAVRHRGQLYKVQIEHAPLASALTNVGVDQLGTATRAAGEVNRYFSAVLTRYNPGFIPVNASRDALFGLTGLAAEHGEGMMLRAAAYYPQAMRAAWRESRRLPPKSQADAYAREFAADGGKTGFVSMPSVEELQRKIGTGKFGSYTPDGMAKAARALADIVGAMNDAIENALRLSAYVTLRESGMTREAAAEYAKNLTVNFNRKGSEGTKLNSWFLFYNASVQGAKRTSSLLRHPKVWGYLGALAGLQVAAAMYAMGVEDDDGTPLWDKIPDYVKQRNIVLTWRNDKGEQHLATIPMPYGFNVMPYLAGRVVSAMSHPDDRPSDRAAKVVADTLAVAVDSFSPLPIGEGPIGFAPEALGIALGIQVNRDDFGRPIRKENPYAKFDAPRASMGKPDTLELFKLAATGLNRVGGGDDRTPPTISALDRAPEDIEYLLNKIGGGAGKFVIDLATLGQKALGAAPIDAKDIPITKRFLTNIDDPAAQQSMFYDRRETIEKDADHVRDVFESQGEDAALELMKAKPSLSGATFKRYKRTENGHQGGAVIKTEGRPQIVATSQDSLYGQYKAADKSTKAINESMRNTYTNEPGEFLGLLPNPERDRKIRDMTKQRMEAQKAFNAQWNRTVVGGE